LQGWADLEVQRQRYQRKAREEKITKISHPKRKRLVLCKIQVLAEMLFHHGDTEDAEDVFLFAHRERESLSKTRWSGPCPLLPP